MHVDCDFAVEGILQSRGKIGNLLAALFENFVIIDIERASVGIDKCFVIHVFPLFCIVYRRKGEKSINFSLFIVGSYLMAWLIWLKSSQVF